MGSDSIAHEAELLTRRPFGLEEKVLNIQMAMYFCILINRQSIHPIDTYVHKEACDFTLEDLEDIILFLGL